MRILFRGGRIIDPASQRDETGDLLVEDGKILEVGGDIEVDEDAREVNANGAWVLPGLIDLGPRLGEPGFEYLETIDTATRAAVAGGIYRACAFSSDQTCHRLRGVGSPAHHAWLYLRPLQYFALGCVLGRSCT